ncbi:MAG: glycoside hydrolase family 65 [Blastocatellia bacterium]|nr:MAG: glycoside hydrolase family 65 [Blastocatellia bacterium]
MRQSSIDRVELVKRHNPRATKLDPLSPFSIGNGEFAFTADITGLQTFPDEYENAMPLCTLSQWGWHTSPKPDELNNKTLRLKQYETHGRKVGYHTSSEGQPELFNWLRENPHRLHLGRIGLCLFDNAISRIKFDAVSNIEQRLDIWRGVLLSKFELNGRPVSVTTAVHPEIDLLAVNIESPLLKSGLAVSFAFPYGSPAMNAASWSEPTKHQTSLTRVGRNSVILVRSLDKDAYSIAIDWDGNVVFRQAGTHTFILKSATDTLKFIVGFFNDRRPDSLPGFQATVTASDKHWRRFWNSGGVVELAGSNDHRANELERRIVLSQYLTAIQCAGSLPPQETGLTVNSWYGKFHLEMHWWHAAHFALWNRLPLFEKSLAWYETILPKAKQLASSQGYDGVRWPKMVGPEGDDSPSPIGPLLIWQQPHPIFYAELCYQSQPRRETLVRYRDIVFESARFMASFAYFDTETKRFWLGPPVIPAQENHPPQETWNPTFELAYWSYALKVAQRWRERLGLKRSADWDQVISKLSPLPVRDGVYLAHENCPQTFTERNRDHPSMLGAMSFLPGDGVDVETMRRTLNKTLKEWRWDETWGWDYPLVAMTAARLGEGKLAIDALLMSTEKNRYLPNGHNWQRANLPCYLPGNGGLLYAVAMMAGGWRGAPNEAPGFPADGTWHVRTEGLRSKELVT